MDKNKQRSSVYPSATRGTLANEQVHKKFEKKPLSQVRDYSPQTTIMQAVLICLAIGVLGIGTYAYYYAEIRKTNPDTAAYAIAKKFAELKTSQTYDQLETETASVFNWCKAPIITITYDYGKVGETRRSDNTVIDTGNIKELTPILDEIVTKGDSAVKNTYDITCPGNPSI